MIVRLSVVLGPLLACLAGAGARREDQVMPRRGRQEDRQMTEDMVNIKMLEISVPGIPGQDFPILATVPDTSFSCTEKLTDRNYADKEAFCQVYHTCVPREDLDNVKFSRLCPNGTIFDQVGQTCRWWYLVDCDKSEQFFNVQQQEDNSVDYEYTYDYDNGQEESSSSSSSNSFSSENNDLSNVNTFLFAIPQGLLNENILNNVFKFPLPSNFTTSTDIVSDIFSSSSSSSSSSSTRPRPNDRDELFQPVRPRPRPQRNRNRVRNRVQGNQGTRIRNNEEQLNTISNQARTRNENQQRFRNNNEQRLGQQQSLAIPKTNSGRRTTIKNGKIFFEN